MSEKEKDVIKRISNTLTQLDKENQKYILGIAEGMAIARESERRKYDSRTNSCLE